MYRKPRGLSSSGSVREAGFWFLNSGIGIFIYQAPARLNTPKPSKRSIDGNFLLKDGMFSIGVLDASLNVFSQWGLSATEPIRTLF
jgi:hypothetical protein